MLTSAIKIAQNTNIENFDIYFTYCTLQENRLFVLFAEVRIAGHTTEYVNKVLDKLKNGGTSVTTLDDL